MSPIPEKLKELLKELEKLKAIKDGGPLAGLLYDLTNKLSMAKGEQGIRGEKGDKGDKGNQGESIQGKTGKDGKDGIDGKNGKDGTDGLNGIDGANGKDGLNGADGSQDTPEMIKSKLESLEDEDKLKIADIYKLQEELDKLKKQIERKTIMGGGAGATGGHVVKAYDLSDVLNGSTKTFSLPAFWRVISVVSSSFPNAFRPTVDYTTDASAMTITFTSEIDAATTLATGQTIIVTYSE